MLCLSPIEDPVGCKEEKGDVVSWLSCVQSVSP